ncbi:MAG TPA: transcriptional repressor [Chloroflexi bacterium]|nr:transcriptional repressor [Chloroflexota bacterium]
MSCHQQAAESLRLAGYRLTPQRMMILEAVYHLGGHVTAEQILAYVQRRHPYVDLSTVYRTIDLLTGLGVVQAFDVSGGASQYELAAEPHHHLVCRVCGSVEPLADYHLRELSAHLLKEHGFQADLDHLAITGLCAACRASIQG